MKDKNKDSTAPKNLTFDNEATSAAQGGSRRLPHHQQHRPEVKEVEVEDKVAEDADKQIREETEAAPHLGALERF
jgi:hypothetical protein